MVQESVGRASAPGLPAGETLAERDLPPRPTPEDLYRPLLNSEIRLITLRPGRWQDPIVCDLITVLLDDKPKFMALSYAWGNAARTQPITLNKQIYDVTVNLFRGLRRLRHIISKGDHSVPFITERLEDFHLWADAVCINQGDDHEKTCQIVRMRDIYTFADWVCAWLGENTQEDDILIRRIFDMTKSNDLKAKGWAASFEEELRNLSDDLIAGVAKLSSRSWFSRVWVVQELTLATKETILLAGEKWTDIKDLLKIVIPVERFRSGFEQSFTYPLVFLHRIRQHYVKYRTVEVAFNMDTSALCTRLDKVVGGTHGWFKATLPDDYIYGLLGLISSGELPCRLQPDYNKPVGQVYQEYARITIENTGNLSILFRNNNSLQGLPSWVPDFSSKSSAIWQKRSADITNSLSFSQSGDQFTLRGVEIGSCSLVYTPPCRDLDDLYINCLGWLQQLDIFLTEVSDITDSTWDDTLERWLQLNNGLGTVASEIKIIYKSIICGKARVNWYEQSEDVKTLFKKSLRTCPTLATSSGILAALKRVDRISQPDDILVAVRETSRVILLRPNKENGMYAFLGYCDCVRFEHTQELFSNKILKEFVVA